VSDFSYICLHFTKTPYFKYSILALIKSISGIRGTIGGETGENLTPIDIVLFASAYGKWLQAQNPSELRPTVVMGRDARISGEMVADLVASTLLGMGINIMDLGLSTTPTVEFAVSEEQAHGGIIITASHNPGQWNALKLLSNTGEFLTPSQMQAVLAIAQAENFNFAKVNELGQRQHKSGYIDRHIDKILKLELVDVEAIKAKNFNLIIDCVNSTGGIAVPRLLERLGVTQVTCLYCEPNGRFPHNPEPLPENLNEISNKMETGSFHLGIVVDPDVDRLAFVCEDGTPFGEEYTLVAVADYVLKSQGGDTVSNLSSTRALKDVTEKAGFTHHESAVGEINVVEMMKAQNAVIGGEGNGGIIYPPMHYGRDALTGIALFLSHLAKFKGSAKMLRMQLPNYSISKNKIELTPEIDVDRILLEIEKKYSKQPINKIDGVKIYFDKEWVQLRKSNTEPIIRIYAESDAQPTAQHLADKIISDIREIISQKVEE